MHFRSKIIGYNMNQQVISCTKFNKQPVTSAVPWGLILGPTLFNIQVNNLDDGIECVLSEFVGNSKLSGVIDMLEGCGNLSWLEKWPEQDLTAFSKDKCIWEGITPCNSTRWRPTD